MKQKTEKPSSSLLGKKLMVTPKGWATNPKERLSYYLYFAGQNAIYNLVSTFLTTYLLLVFATESVGVDAKAKVKALTAGVMLVVKLWDAVNDVIFGVIFDKIRFKSGKKFVPWLKISLVFIPLTTILLFAIPTGLSTNVKLVWLAVAYLLWDTAYTLCDVPIFGIVTAMSENLEERTSLLSYKSIWSGVGSGVAIIAASILPSEKIGLSYTVVAIVCAVFAILTMIPACSRLEERYVGEQDENFTVGSMFRYLFSNKYLLIYYFGYLFYSSANVAAQLNLYVAFYLYNDSIISLVAQACSIAPSLVAALIVPQLCKKMDKMKLFRICTLLAIVMSVVMYIPGYKSLAWFIIATVLRSVPMSAVGVMLFMFTPDCAEYGLYKTGVDAKGITFSIQTFMVKLTAAISSALVIFFFGLKFVDWKDVPNAENFEDLAKSGITQSDRALGSLWFLYVIIPAIGYLIAYLIWTRYKMTDKDVQVMADCNTGKITREEAEASLSRKY